MRSLVTTKRGDAGETTALSGEAYPKSHAIMECVGSLDELRAHTAAARLMLLEESSGEAEASAAFLLWLLHVYFLIGTACSDPDDKHPEYRRGAVSAEHLTRLEVEQGRLEAMLSLPRSFLVSATNRAAAQVDVTCTVARRFERNLVRLKEACPGFKAGDLSAFANRLSDYLFVLARTLEGGRHLPVDYALLDTVSGDGVNAG